MEESSLGIFFNE